MGLLSTIGSASARAFGFTRSAIAVATDAFFNRVTLLLPGNGTNGAQNNTFLDSSSNTFTITRNGNTTQGTFSPFSQTGWSNYFDGSSSFYNTSSTTATSFSTGDFTIEAFLFWPSTASGNQTFFETTNSSRLIFGRSSTGVRLFWYGTEKGFSYSFATNTWYHIALTRSSGTVYCYINGVSSMTPFADSTNISNTRFDIGRNSDNAEPMTGYVSNLRVVKGTAVYSGTGSFTTPTSPLTAITNTSLLTCQSNRFVDNSTNAIAFTISGSPSVQAFSPFAPTAAYSAATVGGSGYFDGTGDYVDTPSNTAFTMGTGAFTVEAWVYPTANLTGSSLFLSGTITNDFQFGQFSGNQFGLASFGIAWLITSSSSLTTNAWNHCVFVRSGTGTNQASLFLNGARVANGTVSQNFTNTQVIRSGFSYTGYLAGCRVIKGSAAYDPTQTTITVPTAPLTAITNTSLLLNFTNAGITDATAKNDLETVGNAQISTTQSKFGGSSMYFDGTGDYLTSNPATTDLYAFGSGDFTIEMWLYLNSVTGTQVIYDQRPLAGGVYPTIYMSGSTIYYYTNGANRITGSTLSTSVWYHVAVSRSGTNTRLFINGSQSGSTYTDSNVYLNTALRPFIGGDGTNIGTNVLNGYIDDLRITKGYARYTANFTAPTTAFPLQ